MYCTHLFHKKYGILDWLAILCEFVDSRYNAFIAFTYSLFTWVNLNFFFRCENIKNEKRFLLIVSYKNILYSTVLFWFCATVFSRFSFDCFSFHQYISYSLSILFFTPEKYSFFIATQYSHIVADLRVAIKTNFHQFSKVHKLVRNEK